MQPSVLTVEYLDAGWTPHAVLDRVAVTDPPVNALIDTGALVTGLTNYEVAQYLLHRYATEPQALGQARSGP